MFIPAKNQTVNQRQWESSRSSNRWQPVTRFFQVIREFIAEFCSNSSIHGVRYFTEPKRHWSERLWWIVAFSFSFWLCGWSIRNIWIQWQDNPVSMSISDEVFPTTSVPFPTLTICSHVKMDKQKLDMESILNIAETKPFNLSNDEVTRLKDLFQICPFYHGNIWKYDDISNFTTESIYKTIVDVAPHFNDSGCAWDSWYNICDETYTPILTDDGLCFSLNALNSHEVYTNEMAMGMQIVTTNPNMSNWHPENGYGSETSKDDEYPIRYIERDGREIVTFDYEAVLEDIGMSCYGSLQGVRVIFSVPGDMPNSRKSIKVSYSEETAITIRPKLVVTSDGLRRLKPSQRKCFFNSERQLRFFKIYTQNNCETECLSNFTKIRCDCVPFFMPRDKDTKICGIDMTNCYISSASSLYNKVYGKDFISNCNCLPSCTLIKYETFIDRIKFNEKKDNSAYQNKEQKLQFGIAYNDQYMTVLTRKETYTFSDFMSACGGLLGLFLGISVLSVMEFIYYFTLRLFWTVRRENAENAVTQIQPFYH